ncbi:MAG: DUF11 domain-containing protein, partial [Clostridia bacterium]|nr:DUF11 domain-containing protein [Clostridia bacterium]
PEGLVNAQMITGYKDNGSIISVNQGRKEDTVGTFKEARQAEMKMIVINNTDEDMKNVSILGRTIFNGNKAITEDVALGTNITAPMTTRIATENAEVPVKIYYSEKEDATKDLDDSKNDWTEDVTDIGIIRSYLIVLEDDLKVGSILTYKYGFNIPEKLVNNIDLVGTFATYYEDEESSKVREADRVVLTTGDAPVLKVETVSDMNEGAAVEGERIRYTVRVTNEGRSVSEDVIVNSIIPESTTYVNDNGELEPDTDSLKIEIGSVLPGETVEATYEVEVDSSVENQSYLEINNNVEAAGLETPIYTNMQSTPIQEAEIRVKMDATLKNRTIAANSEITYTTHISNISSADLSNAKIIQTIPEGTEVVEAYVEEFNDDGVTTYKGPEGVYNEQNRTITWTVDSIRIFKTFKLILRTNNITELEKDITTYSKVIADGLVKEYESNKVRNTLAREQLEVDYYASTDNRYIKEGDTIKYILQIKNTGKVEASEINLSNNLPSEFRVTSLKCNKEGYTFAGLASKNPTLKLNLPVGQTAEVVLDCTVENLSNSVAEKMSKNSWTISGNNLSTTSTQTIENIVQQNSVVTNNTYEDVLIDVPEQGEESKDAYVDKEILSENLEVNNSNVYKIIGKAFDDKNKNGQRDDNEDGIENIVAKLCDVSSQKIVAQTVTNAGGEYVFDNVPVGDYYVKFEYDSSKYQVTDYKKEGVNSDKNSDAIVSNYKAVTDKISITDSSVSDIDIGLYRAGIFDFSLDANINRLTVQNDKGTTTYEMENSKLAKVDIDPKETSSSKIFVEYTIDVSNKGEIAGYAKSIMSYLPEELELDTSLNANWYVDSNRIAHTRELENEIIQPGETKTITLVLTKQMTDDGTGLINNVFEIENTFNEYAISDIDSVEGNHADGEDDMSSADVIIGIKTGGSMINVMIIT